MKVIIGSDHLGRDFPKRLAKIFPETEFVTAFEKSQQKKAASDAQVFFGWPDGEIFEACKKLKWIACPGTGIDKIVSIPEIANSNIPVTNAPGAHVPAMTEHVFGMMIFLARNFKELIREQQLRIWDDEHWFGRMEELGGRTIGIFGFGRLGRSIGLRAFHFGMRVLAVDPDPGPDSGSAKVVWGLDRLDELVKMSDWLIIAAPYIPETHHLINADRIRMMKLGARVIVISRGGIVEENALVEALKNGHLAGAGIDATEIEPLPKDSPLWDQENVLLTQHASALTPELFEGRRLVFIDNLRRFVDGIPLQNICDKNLGY